MNRKFIEKRTKNIIRICVSACKLTSSWLPWRDFGKLPCSQCVNQTNIRNVKKNGHTMTVETYFSACAFMRSKLMESGERTLCQKVGFLFLYAVCGKWLCRLWSNNCWQYRYLMQNQLSQFLIFLNSVILIFGHRVLHSPTNIWCNLWQHERNILFLFYTDFQTYFPGLIFFIVDINYYPSFQSYL